MSADDPLTERLNRLCAEYVGAGSGVREGWYADVAGLRQAAFEARHSEMVQAIDALPRSDFKSPYWVL